MSPKITALKRSGEVLENPNPSKKQKKEPIQSAIEALIKKQDIEGAKKCLKDYRLLVLHDPDLVKHLKMVIHVAESELIWEEYERPRREELTQWANNLIERCNKLDERHGYILYTNTEIADEIPGQLEQIQTTLEDLLARIQEGETLDTCERGLDDCEAEINDIKKALDLEELPVEQRQMAVEDVEGEESVEDFEFVEGDPIEEFLFTLHQKNKEEINQFFLANPERQEDILGFSSPFQLGLLLKALSPIPAELLVETVSPQKFYRALLSTALEVQDFQSIAVELSNPFQNTEKVKQLLQTIPLLKSRTLDLRTQYLNPLFADVNVRIGSQEFPAHRALLSLDPYFTDRLAFPAEEQEAASLHLKRLYGAFSLADYANPLTYTLLEESLNFEQLFNDEFCDIVLEIDGEEIRAHKVIVSSAFALLSDSLKYHPSNREKLSVIKMRALRNILNFIYKDEAPQENNAEIAEEIRQALSFLGHRELTDSFFCAEDDSASDQFFRAAMMKFLRNQT